jgi:hypothetical protein
MFICPQCQSTNDVVFSKEDYNQYNSSAQHEQETALSCFECCCFCCIIGSRYFNRAANAEENHQNHELN